MATAESPMASYRFDDCNIQWRELGDFKHMMVSIFFVDEEKNLVDFIVKFDQRKGPAASTSRRHQHLCCRG